MLTEVRNHIKLIFTSLKYNLLKEMEYRVAFISQVIGMILNNGSFIIQWIILFSLQSHFGGYLFEDVMLIWAVAAGAYGLNRIIFGNSINISNYVLTGKLDSYLVQPKNVLLNLIVSRSSASAIGDLLYGYIVIFIVGFTLESIALYTILILIGAIIFTAFTIIMQSLAFWLGRAEGIAAGVENAMLMPSTYPEGLFSGVVKTILFTVIPVGYMVYLPVRILRQFDILTMLSLLGFTALIVVIAVFIFYRGLKRYSSSNLMIVRM